MISRSIKGKVLVFAVFFVGIVSGILIANFYDERVAGMRREMDREQRAERAQGNIKRFHDYLGLSEQQRTDVSRIMEEMRSEMRKLSQETQPRFRAIEEGYRDKVRALLSDEQRVKYDEFRARRNADREGRGDRGGRDRYDGNRNGSSGQDRKRY